MTTPPWEASLPSRSTVIARNAVRRAALGGQVERVVVEAMKLGLDEDDLNAAIAAHWKKLGGGERRHTYK